MSGESSTSRVLTQVSAMGSANWGRWIFMATVCPLRSRDEGHSRTSEIPARVCGLELELSPSTESCKRDSRALSVLFAVDLAKAALSNRIATNEAFLWD